MADITFSSPNYKNKTLYAVAGSHTETVLQLARENKIPINFNCQDGECGTCLVKVTSLEDKARMAGPLTDKERAVLLELGKITKEQIDKMLVDDFPCTWRLACQEHSQYKPPFLSPAVPPRLCWHLRSAVAATRQSPLSSLTAPESTPTTGSPAHFSPSRRPSGQPTPLPRR